MSSYKALSWRLKRKGIRPQAYGLRKYDDSFLNSEGIDSKMVDMIHGRIDRCAFMGYYNQFAKKGLKELGERVLAVWNNPKSESKVSYEAISSAQFVEDVRGQLHERGLEDILP